MRLVDKSCAQNMAHHHDHLQLLIAEDIPQHRLLCILDLDVLDPARQCPRIAVNTINHPAVQTIARGCCLLSDAEISAIVDTAMMINTTILVVHLRDTNSMIGR